MRTLVAILLVALPAWAACSAPSGPSGPEEPPPPPRPAYPEYETFDPAGYDAEPPPSAVVVEHDVPDRLMDGHVALPDDTQSSVRTVDGFRIQIFSGEDRIVAEGVLSDARAWWDTRRGALGVPSELQPDVAYIQPYYRVRIGAFESRQDAERMLGIVRQRYADAFLVPDLVTIRD